MCRWQLSEPVCGQKNRTGFSREQRGRIRLEKRKLTGKRAHLQEQPARGPLCCVRCWLSPGRQLEPTPERKQRQPFSLAGSVEAAQWLEPLEELNQQLCRVLAAFLRSPDGQTQSSCADIMGFLPMRRTGSTHKVFPHLKACTSRAGVGSMVETYGGPQRDSGRPTSFKPYRG